MYACIHAIGAAEKLRECAGDFSPWVEETAPDAVVVSIDGLSRLFGSPESVAEAMVRRAAALGVEASVAVAENPDAAVFGARGFAGVTIMTPGREAGLPVEALGLPEEIAATLALWGVRTFGELAALPENGVAERLGPEGVHYQELARGAGRRPLQPANPPPPLEAVFELEYPATLLDPLAFILGRLLGELCAQLESRGLAAHELTVDLKLETGAVHERVLRLPFPMRDPKTFLKLATLDLEAHPPGAPVTGVALRAEPVNPRVVQHGLFLPQAPEPQKLELTLARIARIVGEGNVGAAELLDTHRPGAFRMKRFVPGAAQSAGSACSPRLALRVYRPPLRARVQTANGRPVRVEARGVQGRALEAAGPWRSSGEWWREDAWSRDEWDVALSDGALYLLYRDRRDGAWFVEGSYD